MTYKPNALSSRNTQTTQTHQVVDTKVNYQAELSRYEKSVFHLLPKNSQIALMSDKKRFLEFCEASGEKGIPTEPLELGELIVSYASWLIENGNKRKTVDRRLSGLRKYLRIMKIPFPMDSDETLRDSLKLTIKKANARSGQADGLKTDSLKKITSKINTNRELVYKDIRDVTLLNVAFDTLLRRQSLVDIKMDDLNLPGRTLFVRNSKTDQDGKGVYKHLTETTVSLIEKLLAVTPYSGHGYLFRPAKNTGAHVETKDFETCQLQAGEVSRIFKSLSRKIGVDPKRVSGHSTRVGATQVMFELGVSLSKITQAGDWSSPEMPLHYGSKYLASQGATADVAKKTGR